LIGREPLAMRMPGRKPGIRNLDDLQKRRQFNIGAAAQGTASFVDAAVLKNMVGITVRFVSGYEVSAQVRLAIERGELDGDCATWSSLLRLDK